jgi:hypothetical protein
MRWVDILIFTYPSHTQIRPMATLHTLRIEQTTIRRLLAATARITCTSPAPTTLRAFTAPRSPIRTPHSIHATPPLRYTTKPPRTDTQRPTRTTMPRYIPPPAAPPATPPWPTPPAAARRARPAITPPPPPPPPPSIPATSPATASCHATPTPPGRWCTPPVHRQTGRRPGRRSGSRPGHRRWAGPC